MQLACDPALSRLLEDLIHTAEPPQLISFISGCASNEFALVACNPNGSHVLEGTLRGVARHLEGVGIGAGGEEEEWVEELRSCLTAVGQVGMVLGVWFEVWNLGVWSLASVCQRQGYRSKGYDFGV